MHQEPEDNAHTRINDWKADFNETRPHSSLRNLTPKGECGPIEGSPKGRMNPGPEMG